VRSKAITSLELFSLVIFAKYMYHVTLLRS